MILVAPVRYHPRAILLEFDPAKPSVVIALPAPAFWVIVWRCRDRALDNFPAPLVAVPGGPDSRGKAYRPHASAVACREDPSEAANQFVLSPAASLDPSFGPLGAMARLGAPDFAQAGGRMGEAEIWCCEITGRYRPPGDARKVDRLAARLAGGPHPARNAWMCWCVSASGGQCAKFECAAGRLRIFHPALSRGHLAESAVFPRRLCELR